jgi:hypothetical protein
MNLVKMSNNVTRSRAYMFHFYYFVIAYCGGKEIEV